MVLNPGEDIAVKIYTKTGDDGTTGILGRGRVPKDDLRIAAYGTVDELNALLGVARAHGLDAAAEPIVAQLQNELFLVGSALADPSPEGQFHNTITQAHVEQLEHMIDALEAELKPLVQFILPGGVPAARKSPPGPHRLPPGRAPGRRALAQAGRGRRAERARLPQSAQ